MDAKLMRKASVLFLGLAAAMVAALHAGNSLEAASVGYTYDDLGRVRTARYDNGICVIYSYDANGNRTAQTNVSGGIPATPTWGTGVFGCFYWTP